MTRARSLFRAARCRPARPVSRHLVLLSLEDRVTPAHNITIATGGLGVAPAGVANFADTFDYVIDPSALAGGGTLRANNDVTFMDAVNTGSNGLDVLAGRSILVNASVSAARLGFNANDGTAQGANRDPGVAVFTQSGGFSAVTATVGNVGIGLNNLSTSGNISLRSVTAAGHVLITNYGLTAGAGNIFQGAITAQSVALDSAVGAIGTFAFPVVVSAPAGTVNVEARTDAPNMRVNIAGTGPAGSLNMNIGGAVLGGLTGVSATGSVDLGVSGANNRLTISEPVSAGTGNEVRLSAENMTIGAGVTGPFGVVITPALAPAIDLGGADGPGVLGLTAAELNFVTTPSLSIAGAAVAVTVSAPVSPANANALTISTSRSIAVNAALSNPNTGGLLLSANVQPAPTTGNFTGVDVAADVLSSGPLTIQGHGGDAGDSYGVLVRNSATVRSGGLTGKVDIQGTGGVTPSVFGGLGVWIQGPGGTVTSSGGDVKVQGTGGSGANATNRQGVIVGNGVTPGGTITAGGNGKVTVIGTGGSTGAGGSNYGVRVFDGGLISSNAGNVSVTGTGGAGNNNFGVAVFSDGEISAGGTGTVTVAGTATSTVAATPGVILSTTAQITSTGGAVSVTGTGAKAGFDVQLFVNSTISSGGSADLTITVDSLDISSTAVIRAGTAGDRTATIKNRSANTPIDLGGADTFGPATLGLTQTELTRMAANTLVIGSSTAGDLTVTANVGSGPFVNMSLLTGGSLISNASTSVGVSGGLSITVGNDVTLPATATLTGLTSIAITADSPNNDPGTGSTISLLGTLNGPSATITGGSDNDSMTLANPMAVPTTVTGGSGTDSLAAVGGNDAFVLTGTNAGTLNATTSFTSIENLDGAGGTDTLTGDNTSQSFTISSANGGTVSPGLSGSFVSMENLASGSADDTFLFTTGTLSGSINGGGGNDFITGDNTGRTYAISAVNGGTVSGGLLNAFSNVENLNGGSGGDTFQFTAPGTLGGSINGNGGNDTLIGDGTGRTFTINAANGGTVSGILGGSFASVETVTGGAGDDIFQFTGGTLSGTINGAGGNDKIIGDGTGRTYTINAVNGGSISGGLLNGFSNVESLVGGAGGDLFQFTAPGTLAGSIDGGGGTNSLTGDNTGRLFTINASNSGTVATILAAGFSNINNLTGGTGGDTFQFTSPGTLSGNINGGNGNDTLIGDDTGRTFTINAANGGTVSGILGGTFASVETLTGGIGGDTFQFTAPGTLSGNINGGGGTDTLVGDGTGRTFTITGANAGTVSGILTGTFSNMESLTGGALNDNFNFNTNGSLAGSINGGGGTNSITGDNAIRTYTINAANGGTISTILGGTFSNITNLTGGTANDTFQFANGGTLSGNINAGNGADDLIADDGGRTFVVTAQGSGTLAGLLGGTFSLVNNLIGGAGADTFQFNVANGLAQSGGVGGNVDGKGGNDTLIGDNTAHTYAVTAANGGTVAGLFPGTFANVENLTGGSAGDQFTFSGGSLGGDIEGGGGTNNLTGDNVGHTYTIDAANGGTITTLLGGTFANIQNLTSGSAVDRFQFVTPGTLAGNIDGGGASDTLAGDDAARTYTVTGANTGTVSTILGGTFVSIENLEGGALGDTLIVQQPGSLSGSFDGKAGTDSVDLSAQIVGQSLTVAALGGVDGFDVTGSPIAGGLKNINALTATTVIDTLTGLNANTQWSVTALNGGTYQDIGTTRTMAIAGFENLVGGNAIDLFVFGNGGSLTGTVAGNGGTDTVDGDDAGRTFDVSAAGVGTVTVILPAGFTGIENLIGGAGADRLVMEAAGSLAGSFDGLAASDTADLALLTSQQINATALGTTDGFNTTGGTSVTSGLYNLDVLIGSLNGTTDKLTGLATAGTYNVATANAGGYTDNPSARTLTFANIENLTAGQAADTLIVQAPGFLGGEFIGKAGYDKADLSALGAQSPLIAAIGTTDGYDLNNVPAVASGLKDLEAIIGSSAATTDKLTGRDVAATWTVNAPEAGQYVDTSNRTLDFSKFENLSGGSDKDKLIVQAGGSLTGAFDGGLGIDTGDLSAQPSQQFVAKQLGGADGYDVTGVPTVAGDLKNVDAVIGSTAGTTDRLTGLNTVSTYTVNAQNGGSYQDDASARQLAFSKVENLNGGIAADLLVVKTGGTLAGTFDGSYGFDDADLSDLAPVQSITVIALGSTDGFNTTGGTNVTGGLLNVDKVVGGKSASATLGSSDRLTGLNADATWQMKFGVDQNFYQDVGSSRKLVFANFEELFGGTAKDAITVDYSVGNPLATSGLTVDGQAGFDSLSTIGTANRDVFFLGVKIFRVNGKVIRYKNLEKMEATGGTGNDLFYAPNVNLPSSVGIVRFFGEGGNDTAWVSPTVLALLHLEGGDGTDTLKVIRASSRFITPIPARSVVSGTYFFSNRRAIEFISFEIRDIGITQPQP